MPELLADPLWVPILTHYLADGQVDQGRIHAHVESLQPHVSQLMIGGSTGDGWELDDTRFAQLLDATASIVSERHTVVFGALRPSTREVIQRIELIERALDRHDLLHARSSGVVVCPPVGDKVTQKEILDHFGAVIDATNLNIVAYQLPQVTLCRMAPETMTELSRSSQVTMFKDSSGEDTVATATASYGAATLVRGAEGRYLDLLAPHGPYHGWLLSTGNVASGSLRRILAAHRGGRAEEAGKLAANLAATIQAVFDAAANEGGANAFSNANRAMDHLHAYGSRWRDAPLPLKANGTRVSSHLISEVEKIAAEVLQVSEKGYLSAVT